MHFNQRLNNFNSNYCKVVGYEDFILKDQVCKSNILNKQWGITVGPPACVLGEALTNPHLMNLPCYEKMHVPRSRTDRLVQNKQWKRT
jgi:hypothetical protein